MIKLTIEGNDLDSLLADEEYQRIGSEVIKSVFREAFERCVREYVEKRFEEKEAAAMKKWMDQEWKDGRLKIKDGMVYIPMIERG